MFTWLKNHKVIVIAIVFLVGFGLYRYFSTSRVTYTQYSVSKADLQETFELSGKVDARSSATLRFSAGGLVTYLGAKEGDRVRKWQTLASIDTRQLQKTLEQKLNLYSVQRGTFDQTIDDNDNSIPDGDLGRTLKRLLVNNKYQLDKLLKMSIPRPLRQTSGSPNPAGS
jgi:multidrug efflux pump subunit AcrA (membrane-fusion protein)